MSEALLEFGDRLLAGLTRASISSASKWAEHYRRNKNGQPWRVHGYAPWSLEWHDARPEEACILKGAQLTATESMLSRGMYANDILKQDVLYVLPKWRPTASDFSLSRFDVAVNASPYLEKLYVERNVGHKRTSLANFYIRGGQGRDGLKSVPVNELYIDEIDEMNQENVPLAKERTSGQLIKSIWYLSTPTIDDHGIDREWKESSQEHYVFPCPRCSRHIEFMHGDSEMPRCLEIVGDDPNSARVKEESYLKCPECSGRISHQEKHTLFTHATWNPMIAGRSKRGFSINQFYSMTVTPGNLAVAFLKGRLSAPDEQEYWNSKMGLPHTPKGAKLTQPEVEACRRDYFNGSKSQQRLVTMGIDVGKYLHFEIDEWQLGDGATIDVNAGAACRVLKAGKVRDFAELDTLMMEYEPTYCVIDAHPERRMAQQFANRFYGHVSMCIYGNGVSGKELHEHLSNEREPLVTCDRTSWLDQSLSRFRTPGKITLPRDVPFEYIDHLTALARIWEFGADGNPVGRYVTPTGKADHHAHARNYAEIALALSTGLRVNHDVNNPLEADGDYQGLGFGSGEMFG